jgi:hypothetical protein
MDNNYMVIVKKPSVDRPMVYGQYRSKETADNEAAKVKANNPFWTVIVKSKS